MTTDNKRLVLVLGMHRSGTSAITRALVALGFDPGRQVLDANYYNQKGYWEDREIVIFNDRLLASLGHAWDSVPLLPADYTEHAAIDVFRQEAQALLKRKLEETPWRVLKDPRMSRLLAFWQPVFRGLDVQVDYIIQVRHPLSVAASLEKRDHFAQPKSLLLWLQHNVLLLNATRDSSRFFMHYDDFIAEPQPYLIAMQAFLGLPDSDEIAQAVEEYAQRFLTPDLRHSCFSFADLQNCSVVFADVLHAYRLLIEVCHDQDLGQTADFISQWQLLADHLENAAPLLSYIQEQVLALKRCRLDQERLITAQLYWLSAEQPEYIHINRLDATCRFAAQPQTLWFDFPLYVEGVRNIRFDLADCPAFIVVQALSILNAAQQEVWEWAGEADIFGGCSPDLLRYAEPEQKSPWFISVGNDPFVHLLLPESIVQQVGAGWFFKVTLTIRPLSVCAGELLSWLQQRDTAIHAHQQAFVQLNNEVVALQQEVAGFDRWRSETMREVARSQAQLDFLNDLM